MVTVRIFVRGQAWNSGSAGQSATDTVRPSRQIPSAQSHKRSVRPGPPGPLPRRLGQAGLRLTLEIVKRSDDLRGFVVLPRRWCVERTLGRLWRSRRLVRDGETRPAISEAVAQWSMAVLMRRRLACHRPCGETLAPPGDH